MNSARFSVFSVFFVVLLISSTCVFGGEVLPNFPNQITENGTTYYLVATGKNTVGETDIPSGIGGLFAVLSQYGKYLKFWGDPWTYPDEAFDLLKVDAERAQEIGRLKYGQTIDEAYRNGITLANAGDNTFSSGYKELISKLDELAGITNPATKNADPYIVKMAKYHYDLIKASEAAGATDAGAEILKAFSTAKGTKLPAIIDPLAVVPNPRPGETFGKFTAQKLSTITSSARMQSAVAALQAKGFVVEIEPVAGMQQGVRISRDGKVIAESFALVGSLDDAALIPNAEEIFQAKKAIGRLGGLSRIVAKNFHNVTKLFQEYQSASGAAKSKALTKLTRAVQALNTSLSGGTITFAVTAAGEIEGKTPAGTVIYKTADEFLTFITANAPEGKVATFLGYAAAAKNRFKSSWVGSKVWWAGGKIKGWGNTVVAYTPNIIKTPLSYAWKGTKGVFRFAGSLVTQIALTSLRLSVATYCGAEYYSGDNQATPGVAALLHRTNTDEDLSADEHFIEFQIDSDFSPIVSCVEEMYNAPGSPVLHYLMATIQFFDLSALTQDVLGYVRDLFSTAEYTQCDLAIYRAQTAPPGTIAQMPISCADGSNFTLLSALMDPANPTEYLPGKYVAFGRLNAGEGAAELVAERAKSKWKNYLSTGVCDQEFELIENVTLAQTSSDEEAAAKWSAWTACIERQGYMAGRADFSIGEVVSPVKETRFSVDVLQDGVTTPVTPNGSVDISKKSFSLVFKNFAVNSAPSLSFNLSSGLASKLIVGADVASIMDPARSQVESAFWLDSNQTPFTIFMMDDGGFGCVASGAGNCIVDINGIKEGTTSTPVESLSSMKIAVFSDLDKDNVLDGEEFFEFTVNLGGISPAGLKFSKVFKNDGKTSLADIVYSNKLGTVQLKTPEPFVLGLSNISKTQGPLYLVASPSSNPIDCKRVEDYLNGKLASVAGTTTTARDYGVKIRTWINSKTWGALDTVKKGWNVSYDFGAGLITGTSSTPPATGTNMIPLPTNDASNPSSSLFEGISEIDLTRLYTVSPDALNADKNQWQILSIDKKPLSDASFNGQQYRFAACQMSFSEDNGFKLISSQDAQLTLGIGVAKCDSVQQCLAKTDKKIVDSVNEQNKTP